MRVQEGSSLHIPIHPSTASLSGFRKPGAVFDGPTCYSVQGEDNKANPPPHLNAPPLRTTNGVTTTGLKRRRIMQEQGTAVQIKHPCTSFSLGHPQICSSAPQPCTSPHAQGKCKSIPTPLSTSIQNKRCDKSGTDKGKRMRVQEEALHVRIHRSTISLYNFRRPTFKRTEKTARPLHTPAS